MLNFTSDQGNANENNRRNIINSHQTEKCLSLTIPSIDEDTKKNLIMPTVDSKYSAMT